MSNLVRKLIHTAAGSSPGVSSSGEAFFTLIDVSNPGTNAFKNPLHRGSGNRPQKDYSFTVPDGVGEIHVVCVAAGWSGYQGFGGNGGKLSYGSMTVVPGETLIVKVGMVASFTSASNREGGNSEVYRGANKLISSDGTGSDVDNQENGGAGMYGSTYSQGTPGGGGGAAGYSGEGGYGGKRNTNATIDWPTNGLGGGGGGFM